MTLPFVCVMLTALLGGAALAVDLGRMYLTASEAQAAADAAALGAVRWLQQWQPYYWALTDSRYGYPELVALNRVANAPAQVAAADIQPVVYNPTTNAISSTSWSDAVSAVTVTVRATPQYVFAGALGLTPPSVARRATAWIANVNGASCVRPIALPYTRMLETGMFHRHQDSTWTKQGGAPEYNYGGIASLQPQWPWDNEPRGRTYTAIPQWVAERDVDVPNSGNGRWTTGRWIPADFSGGLSTSAVATYAGALPKSPDCQAAATQVGANVAPFPGYSSPSATQKTNMLNALSTGFGQLRNRMGNNTDAHCYDSTGAVGVRARVFLTDSVAGSTFALRTREVTMVRIMCYFRTSTDVCAPTYIRDENNTTSNSSYWQITGGTASGYPAGTITVLLDGPTGLDVTSDVIFGNKPGITQRIYLVR